uniref:Secreted protein n=1 Tax=Bursaphelenchus xylophilus TaxID=6326 RepID=A0A1I7SGL3_BURXY
MNGLWLLLFVAGVVAQEPFQCGTDSLSASLAYTAIQMSCPAKLGIVNHCCVVHDACYDQYPGPTREQCDEGFCACLRATQCGGEVPAFCTIVKSLGGEAFRTARIAGCKKRARDAKEKALCDQQMLQGSNEKVEQTNSLQLFIEAKGMAYNCLNPLSRKV